MSEHLLNVFLACGVGACTIGVLCSVWIRDLLHDRRRNQSALDVIADELVARRAESDYLRARFDEQLQAIRELESRAAEAERLSGIGQLVTSVAHEINNPLTFMLMSLRALEARLGRDVPSDIRELVEDATDGVTRVQQIVTELNLSGHTRDARLESIDVRTLLERTARMTQSEWQHKAQLRVHCEPHLFVQADEAMLAQVLNSLVLRAAHAIPLGSGAEHAIELYASSHQSRVLIDVLDTGRPLSMQERARLFDAGDGSLKLPFQLVRRQGGALEARETQKGTVFRLVMPLGEARRAAMNEEREEVASDVPTKVLIVDDETQVGRAIVRMLPEYAITVCRDVASADEVIRQGALFDAVVCDVAMPGASGPELYTRVAENRPELLTHFAFMTAGIAGSRLRAELPEGVPVLGKPFSRESLTLMIERLAAVTHEKGMVELNGIEPSTSAMPLRRSPS